MVATRSASQITAGSGSAAAKKTLAVARAARFQDACREDPKGASGRCASTLSGSEKARISMPVKDALDSSAVVVQSTASGSTSR